MYESVSVHGKEVATCVRTVSGYPRSHVVLVETNTRQWGAGGTSVLQAEEGLRNVGVCAGPQRDGRLGRERLGLRRLALPAPCVSGARYAHIDVRVCLCVRAYVSVCLSVSLSLSL
jgi:hypothetical protein